MSANIPTVAEIISSSLMPLLYGWLGAAFALVTTAGLTLIGFYFLNHNFRRAYNTMFPPSGRHAIYSRDGKTVYRSGWTWNDEDARYYYVRRKYPAYRKGAQ